MSRISNPAPLKVYDTVRYDAGGFSYTFSGLDDTKKYRVRLHFCDTQPTRLFYVELNANPFTPNGTDGFNIRQESDYNTVFCVVGEVQNQTDIELVFVPLNINAIINAIEIIEIRTPQIDVPFNLLGLIPEYFYDDLPEYEKVTNKHIYEDEGVSFNTTNDRAARRWVYDFPGLAEGQAAAMDEHFEMCRFHRDFGFTDRRGYVYDAGIYYEKYEKSHEKNRRWVQRRKITLIEYP
jgi:hypothetical protein